MRESLASPLGSTSRQKIQKTFSIMQKLSASHDGIGGPGMMFNPMDTEQTMAPDTGPITISNEDSRGMVIFHKIPKPRIIYGKMAPTKKQTMDGQGGPGGATLSGGSLDNLFATPFTNSQPTWEQQRDALRAAGARKAAEDKAASLLPQTSINTKVFTPRPEPQTWQPGLIPRLGSWIVNKAIPAVGGAIGAAGMSGISALGGLTEFAQRNLAELPFATWRNLVGKDVSLKDQPGPGWLPLSETKGIQELARMFPQLSSPPTPVSTSVSSTPSGMTDAQRTVLRSQGSAATPGGTTPTATTTASGIPAASFYASLGGSTATTTPAAAIPVAPTETPTSSGGITGGLANLGSTGGTAAKAAKSFTERHVAVERDPSQNEWTQVGTMTKSGYKALGKYQIMPNYHFSKIGLDANSEADVKKFLTTPALQEEVYSKIMTELNTKYNNDQAKVYAAYFGGDAAAQIVGTPAGDDPKYGDGHLSVNQYVSRVIGPDGGTSGGTTGSTKTGEAAPTGVVATALDYIKKNLGAGQFIQDTMKKEGGLLNEQAVENYKKVMKDYDIEKLRLEETTLKKEVDTLPKDYADYIRARDTYIKDTDKAIEDYKAEMEKTNDTSDPAVKQQMSLHLNYLYTLRGRQNATYAGYIKDAVDGHQRKLKDTEDTLTRRLEQANIELASKNAITTESYNNRMASLNDMYTTLKNAPAEALQMTILAAQAHEAQYGSSTDTVKMMKDNSFTQQVDDIKKVQGFLRGTEGYIIPGVGNGVPSVRLIEKINQMSESDPHIQPGNIVTAYINGVESYLTARLSKDEWDGFGITKERQTQLAAEAITEIGLLSHSGDPLIAALGNDHQDKIKNQFQNIFANDISSGGKAAPLMEAIKTLDQGKKAPPTLDEFIKIVTGKTQDEKDSSTAESIYNTYMELIQGGETPSTAVQAFLYPGNTTEERNLASQQKNPFSPLEFSYFIARLVADDIYSRSLLS